MPSNKSYSSANHVKLCDYNNLPGLYPEKFKVYISHGSNEKTWKATNDASSNIFTQTVSHNSRPLNRYTLDNTYNRAIRSNNKGPLNPIKHWRKQLHAVYASGPIRASVSQAMDYPGGAVYLDKTALSDCSSCGLALTNYIVQYPKDISCCTQIGLNAATNFQPLLINNPQRITRPRSSNTILKKNYYTTGAAYLKSRVKTFDQNQTLNPFQSSSIYVQNQNRPQANNNHVFPTNSNTIGSQLYHSNNCINNSTCCGPNLDGLDNSACSVDIIYKPNNPFFSVQGAVSSGTRILDIRYKAITQNNWFTRDNLTVDSINLPGATPVNYRGNTEAPYFIKNNFQQIDVCSPNVYKQSTHSRSRISGRMPSGGSGITTVCFPSTSNSSI